MGPVRRRQFLIGAGALLAAGVHAPRPVAAQRRTVRVGYLVARRRSTALQPVLARLGELGYVEGKNLVLEYRSSDGVAERFPALARELLEVKCDLIFAVGAEQAARALVETRTDVPVVIIAIDYDPVRAGIVPSLQRPGGNVTGITLMTPELVAKTFAVLREVLPRARRFAVFTDPFTRDQLAAVREAAARLGAEIVPVALANPPYAFGPAYEQARQAGCEALLLLNSPVFSDQRATIYELGLQARLPVAVLYSAWWTKVGWLTGYGPNLKKTYARAGDIAARILDGKAVPREIPVERPVEFEFAVNLNTAKTLGIAIPESVLARADVVVQ